MRGGEDLADPSIGTYHYGAVGYLESIQHAGQERPEKGNRLKKCLVESIKRDKD